MANPIKTLVQDYGWVHLGLGLFGNTLFLTGSVAFLPNLGKVALPLVETVVEWQTVGVWLFIVGAAFMLIGSLGNLLISVFESRERN